MRDVGAAPNEAFMREALRLARSAGRRGEAPVGAVSVRDGAVIARAANGMERRGDATAHAEMLVLRAAARRARGWRLEGVTVYCTLEPCPMCAGAMVQARIDRLVYGARDPKKGADGSVYEVLRHARNNHRVVVEEGVLADECGALLSGFFAERRTRSSARRVTAQAGHEISQRAPIQVTPGEQVTVGERDTDWPAFVLVRTTHGEGWVPARHLDGAGGTAVVVTPYDTTELPVVEGEILEVIREDTESGWHWCRSASGREGWVPVRALAPRPGPATWSRSSPR